MDQLKTGSKDFHQWIHDVKYARFILPSLHEKKDYYETKYYSVRTMNFSLFRGSNYQDKDMKTYWLEKIDEIELKIHDCMHINKEYESFCKQLTESERGVLDAILREYISFVALAKEMKVSRNRIYEIKRSIFRKYGK